MSNEFLAGVGYPHPFDELAVELCSSAARQVCILSPGLDHSAFDNEALAEALAALHTLSLTCRIVWIDPAIDAQTRDAMEAYLERHKRQRRHRNIWIRILTWIAIALLAFGAVPWASSAVLTRPRWREAVIGD